MKYSFKDDGDRINEAGQEIFNIKDFNTRNFSTYINNYTNPSNLSGNK